MTDNLSYANWVSTVGHFILKAWDLGFSHNIQNSCN